MQDRCLSILSITYNATRRTATSNITVHDVDILDYRALRANITKQTLVAIIRLIDNQAADGQILSVVGTFKFVARVTDGRVFRLEGDGLCLLVEAALANATVHNVSQHLKVFLGFNQIGVLGAVILARSLQREVHDIEGLDGRAAIPVSVIDAVPTSTLSEYSFR